MQGDSLSHAPGRIIGWLVYVQFFLIIMLLIGLTLDDASFWMFTRLYVIKNIYCFQVG